MKVQVHDFNGGIAPSGLFWTVRVPDDALTIRGWTARLHLEHQPVVDSFVFLGPDEVPATISCDVTWTGGGEMMHFRPGSTDPTDPSNFAGHFRLAVAGGSFSGSETNFAFEAAGASSQGLFAELGRERNGFFLHGLGHDHPGGDHYGREGRTLVRVAPNPVASGALGSEPQVEFDLTRDESVSIAVFDPAGRRVASLLEGALLPPGPHTVAWDLRDREGRRVPTGIYFVRWQTPSEVEAARLVVVH